MECNKALKTVMFPELIIVKSYFLAENENIYEFYAPNIKSIDNAFLRMNKNLENIEFNNLKNFGEECLLYNPNILITNAKKENLILKKIPN